MDALGVVVRRQVMIAGACVVFVIGDRLVVEIDSEMFHDPDADCS